MSHDPGLAPLPLEHQMGLLFVLGLLGFWGIAARICRISVRALFFDLEPASRNGVRCPVCIALLLVVAAIFAAVVSVPGEGHGWLPWAFVAGYGVSLALYLYMRLDHRR